MTISNIIEVITDPLCLPRPLSDRRTEHRLRVSQAEANQ